MEKFGAYKLTFWQSFLVFLIKSKIARGSPRKWVRKLFWSITSADSVFDIIYESVCMRILPSSNNAEKYFLLHDKIHDREEIDFICSAIPKNGVLIDVGANVGYYSLMVAKRFPNARIIAYEPNPSVFKRMTTNIELNNFANITAIESAIGDEEGIVELKIDASNVGASSIKEIEGRVGNENQKIRITTLKDSLENLGIEKIDVLKIDVEGFEDKALLPYFNSVDREFCPDMILIEDFNQDCWDVNVVEFLLTNGYYEFAKTGANLILLKEQI